MALKTAGRKPKVQRGLSLTQELNAAILATADKLGKTWNEVAESALNRVFLLPSDLQNQAKSTRSSQDRNGEIRNDDYDD